MGISAAIGTQAGRALWISWLLALAAAVPFYFWLPCKIAGNIGGKKNAGFFLAYALLITASCLTAVLYVWVEWTMTRAPFALYAALLAILVAYAIERGIFAPLRLAILLFAALLVLAILDTFLLIPQMELHHILLTKDCLSAPVWRSACILFLVLLLPLPGLILAAGRSMTAGLPKAYALRAIRRGFIWGALYLLLSAVRNVLALGDLLIFDHYPLLRALKMTELGIGLSRLEYFGMMALLAVVAVAAMLQLSFALDFLDKQGAACPKRRAAILLGVAVFLIMLLLSAWLASVDFSGKAVAL